MNPKNVLFFEKDFTLKRNLFKFEISSTTEHKFFLFEATLNLLLEQATSATVICAEHYKTFYNCNWDLIFKH